MSLRLIILSKTHEQIILQNLLLDLAKDGTIELEMEGNKILGVKITEAGIKWAEKIIEDNTDDRK
jgi:hypothetical protein